MLVFGCVKEIHDYELIVGLPGGVSGSVAIGNISDAYTELLQNLTKGSEYDFEVFFNNFHHFKHACINNS